jgi:hypothetical protein
MPIGDESYCLRHSEVEAVGRCRQCGVPFCAKCRVEVPEGTYCSMECRAKHMHFVNRSEELNRGKRGGILQKSLMVLLFAAGLAAVLHFLGIDVPVVSDLIGGVHQ